MKSLLLILLLASTAGCFFDNEYAATKGFRTYRAGGEAMGVSEIKLRQKPGGWFIEFDVSPLIYSQLEAREPIHSDIYVINHGQSDLGVSSSLWGFGQDVGPKSRVCFYSGDFKSFLEFGADPNTLSMSARSGKRIDAEVLIGIESDQDFVKHVRIRPWRSNPL